MELTIEGLVNSWHWCQECYRYMEDPYTELEFAEGQAWCGWAFDQGVAYGELERSEDMAWYLLNK